MIESRVLIIDDEPDMLDNCQRLLARAGCATRALADPIRIKAEMAAFAPDVLLLDLRMPTLDGMAVLPTALAEDPLLPVIMMTAYATVSSAVQAIREGAFDYLTKPFTAEQLTVAVQRAVRYRGLAMENRTLRQQVEQRSPFDAIVGSSAAIGRLLDTVRKVAPTDANVLIVGESGTGKELVARCIHDASPRRTGPFVPVDCAALPEALLESELFGHERGAFTGAVTRKKGLLVEAHGGTAFLDEIAELSAGLQAKLLRSLEERRVRPIGSTSLVEADIRIVAATNADLETAVSAGRFRQDLYYRLQVVQVTLPPLRSRDGDVPLLLQLFLTAFSQIAGREPPRVSPEAWAVLEAYHWPGNVRELRNLAQRLTVLDDDGRVTLADLPEGIRGWKGPAGAEPAIAPPPYPRARDHALAEFRRGYVRRLLELHAGNVSKAAAAAGVSRRTFHRWLAQDAAESATDA